MLLPLANVFFLYVAVSFQCLLVSCSLHLTTLNLIQTSLNEQPSLCSVVNVIKTIIFHLLFYNWNGFCRKRTAKLYLEIEKDKVIGIGNVIKLTLT